MVVILNFTVHCLFSLSMDTTTTTVSMAEVDMQIVIKNHYRIGVYFTYLYGGHFEKMAAILNLIVHCLFSHSIGLNQ